MLRKTVPAPHVTTPLFNVAVLSQCYLQTYQQLKHNSAFMAALASFVTGFQKFRTLSLLHLHEGLPECSVLIMKNAVFNKAIYDNWAI